MKTITKFKCQEDCLVVWFDTREIKIPWTYTKRLSAATSEQRKEATMIGRGHGLNWECIDEDISASGILIDFPEEPVK